MIRERVTVAWCRSCKHYVGMNEIGASCPTLDCGWKLTRRVGYICSECWNFHSTVREMQACCEGAAEGREA